MTTAAATATKKRKDIQTVIVVRHGERLDYIMKANGQNWIELPTTDRPWDPPLTETGIEQAKRLGSALFQKTTAEDDEFQRLPPITAVYSSPFLRCRQTAAAMIQGGGASINVQVELGLTESINENWYRSWALPGTDGTWGYMKNEIPNPNPQTLHPASKIPLMDHSHTVLDWKQCPLPDHNQLMDDDHTSQTSLIMADGDGSTNIPCHPYYCYDPPQFESFKMQRRRMAKAMNQLSSLHVDETIILVSHGGPVTHLYESVTGNRWDVHGQSKYCCFSIYQKEYSGRDDDDDDDTNNENGNTSTENKWTPLVVNRALWDTDSSNDDNSNSESNTKRQASFQWS
jgi:broad specificity phosphatase PhoE